MHAFLEVSVVYMTRVDAKLAHSEHCEGKNVHSNIHTSDWCFKLQRIMTENFMVQLFEGLFASYEVIWRWCLKETEGIQMLLNDAMGKITLICTLACVAFMLNTMRTQPPIVMPAPASPMPMYPPYPFPMMDPRSAIEYNNQQQTESRRFFESLNTRLRFRREMQPLAIKCASEVSLPASTTLSSSSSPSSSSDSSPPSPSTAKVSDESTPIVEWVN